MKRAAQPSRTRKLARHAATVGAIGLWLAAGFCAVSYERDCRALSALADELSADAQTPYELVINLMDWVHHDLGTRHNEGYFLFSSLGPTPVQVMRGSGDCADKSRLLCALLREVGVPATPAMSFDPKTGAAVHTIVEAEPVKGRRMIVDPSYNLYFPHADGSDYYDILDIRGDSTITGQRLTELFRNLPGRREEDKYYLAAWSGYHDLSTFNWDARAAYAALRDILYEWIGDDVYHLRRPILLERPKLAVLIGCVFGGLLLLAPRAGRRMRRWRRTNTPGFKGVEKIAAGKVVHAIEPGSV